MIHDAPYRPPADDWTVCATCNGTGYVTVYRGIHVLWINEGTQGPWQSLVDCTMDVALPSPVKRRPFPVVPATPVLRMRAPERPALPRVRRPVLRGERMPRRHSSWYRRKR